MHERIFLTVMQTIVNKQSMNETTYSWFLLVPFFVPGALKQHWPQTSEDIPHFSSHTFLRTEISEEERLSLRLRPMEQRPALSMYRRSANRSASLVMTRRSGSGLFPLRRKRDAQKNQKLNAKVTRHSQQQQQFLL